MVKQVFKWQSVSRIYKTQILPITVWCGMVVMLTLLLAVECVAAVQRTPLQGAGFYSFNIGNLHCAVISDGQLWMTPDTFAKNVSQAEVEKVLKANFLNTNKVPVQVNTLLLQDDKVNILVDTGLGIGSGEGNGLTETHLARLGVKPEDIDMLVITHMHPDHIGGIFNQNGEKNYPNAKLVFSKEGYDFWTNAKASDAHGDERALNLLSKVKAVLQEYQNNIQLVKDGEQITPGIRVHAMYGHTPGHIGLDIKRGEDRLLYISDSIHMAQMQMPHPDWHDAFDMNVAEATESREKVLALAAKERILVSGAHLPFPSLGHVVEQPPAYAWQPILWVWEPRD